MAETLAIAASVITLVNISRKVADGITKITELRHAPEILLALNNEVVDLQCVIEDLAELEQRFDDTLDGAITRSFTRAVVGTKEVLLALDKLIAYKLTKPGDDAGLSRVDRSTSISTQSYKESRRLGFYIETFVADNTQCHQDIAHRLVGVRNQLDQVAAPAKLSAEPIDTASEAVLAGKGSPSTTTDCEVVLPNDLIDSKQASLHDVDSKYGMTALHWAMYYSRVDMASFLVRSGAGPTTREALRESLTSFGGIDDANALGDTLLMKATRYVDEPTGKRTLVVPRNRLAKHEDSPPSTGERSVSEAERSIWRDNQQFTQAHGGSFTPDKDPEQVYRAFRALIQKVVDDHYGFDLHRDHDGGEPRRRMIAVPRKANPRFLDIVDEASIVEVSEVDTQLDESEDPVSGEEEWDDALEDVGETTEVPRDNEEAIERLHRY
ncbi:MAG: hypothetical protein Q9166_008154 [cf. Caloplaca sp. 2 TL-2023]